MWYRRMGQSSRRCATMVPNKMIRTNAIAGWTTDVLYASPRRMKPAGSGSRFPRGMWRGVITRSSLPIQREWIGGESLVLSSACLGGGDGPTLTNIRSMITKRQQPMSGNTENATNASDLDGTSPIMRDSTNSEATNESMAPTMKKSASSTWTPTIGKGQHTWNAADVTSSQFESSAPVLYDLQQAREIFNPDLHLPSAPLSWKGYEESTPLTEDVVAWIGVSGRPMTVADFMRMALQHPTHGYYTQAQSSRALDDFDDDFDDDPTPSRTGDDNSMIIGPGGDFITAPEVSQVFGECLCIWFFTRWDHQLKRSAWEWLECGPGKGTLLVDVLRFASQLSVTEFLKQCRAIHLVEASPALQQIQRQSLEDLQRRYPTRFAFQFHSDSSMGNDAFNTPFSTNGVGTTSTTTTTSSTHQGTTPSKYKLSKAMATIPVYWYKSWMEYYQSWHKQKYEQSVVAVAERGQCEGTVTDVEVGQNPVFTVFQEFLDALPIHSFEKAPEGYWRERLVDVALREDLWNEEEGKGVQLRQAQSAEPASSTNPSANFDTQSSSKTPPSTMDSSVPTQDKSGKKLRLRMVLAPETTPAVRTLLGTDADGYRPKEIDKDVPAGSVIEVSPESILMVQELAKLISERNGAALIVDYGQEGSADTIRGFSKHQQVPFLSQPGRVDITADVDFGALRHAVNHGKLMSAANTDQSYVRAYGPVNQGDFLMTMGLGERVMQLAERPDCTEEQANNLYQCMVRLASPEQMGTRYKVLSIVRKPENNDEPPPGF